MSNFHPQRTHEIGQIAHMKMYVLIFFNHISIIYKLLNFPLYTKLYLYIQIVLLLVYNLVKSIILI